MWSLAAGRRRSRSTHRLAGVAQLVEQLIRNQQVVGSSPTAGSTFPNVFDGLRVVPDPIPDIATN